MGQLFHCFQADSGDNGYIDSNDVLTCFLKCILYKKIAASWPA